jgi:hypothetical protein
MDIKTGMHAGQPGGARRQSAPANGDAILSVHAFGAVRPDKPFRRDGTPGLRRHMAPSPSLRQGIADNLPIERRRI